MNGMTLRRGFKADAKRIADETRAELGLTPFETLDPWALAQHLAIPVHGLEEVATWGCPKDSVTRLTGSSASEFSAITVFHGRFRRIIENSTHSMGRRANSVCHEVAHALLEHEPHALRQDDGTRSWTPEMESEANWLAAELLVPRAAVLSLARGRVPIEDAARRYGVSPELMRWRFNSTGAVKQVARERKRYKRVG